MEVKAGYLDILVKENVYVGGFMIVDSSGIPLEFKYTEKIEPTKIQRIIYGKTLDKYLKEEVISKSLLKELKNVPNLVMVNDYEMIAGKDKLHGFYVAFSQKTTLPRLEKSGDIKRVKDKEIIIQPYQDTNPIRVVFGVGDPELQEKVLSFLKELSRKIDIVEPYERVRKALEVLWEEKV